MCLHTDDFFKFKSDIMDWIGVASKGVISAADKKSLLMHVNEVMEGTLRPALVTDADLDPALIASDVVREE